MMCRLKGHYLRNSEQLPKSLIKKMLALTKSHYSLIFTLLRSRLNKFCFPKLRSKTYTFDSHLTNFGSCFAISGVKYKLIFLYSTAGITPVGVMTGCCQIRFPRLGTLKTNVSQFDSNILAICCVNSIQTLPQGSLGW